MSFRRHMPTRFLINQCQIITFLILKSDIIENLRLELKGIVLPVLQIKLKLHLLLFYPSTWYICDFFLFHIEIEGKCGWIIGWGGKGYVGLTLKLLGGLSPPPPPLFLRLSKMIFFVTALFPLYSLKVSIFLFPILLARIKSESGSEHKLALSEGILAQLVLLLNFPLSYICFHLLTMFCILKRCP